MADEKREDGVQILPPMEPGALSQIVRAEVDMQVSTAKAYPRSIKRAKQDMEDLACISKEVAESCFYTYKRGGKLIEGPSVRLAEIALTSWGNTRTEARVVDVGKREVTAQATTWDMEKNVLVRIESKRRITDKNGNRYSNDMILVTSNAALMIALRNSVFVVVPRAIIDDIYQKARKVAFGDAKAIALSRGAMLETFAKLGVELDRLLAALGVDSVENIGAAELSTLRGVFNSIREGSMKIEDAFPPVPAEGAKPDAPAPASRTASVMDKLREREQEGASAPKPDVVSGKQDETPEAPAPTAPPAEAQPPDAPQQTELPQSSETTKKKTSSGPKKERLVHIEAQALAADITPEDLESWKEEIDIHDGQLRSQSSKRLDALQARVNAWMGAHPAPEPEEPTEAAPATEKQIVVSVSEKIIAGLLDRIHGLIGWEGDEARQWVERVLDEPVPDMAAINPEQAGRLESILDKREDSLAGG